MAKGRDSYSGIIAQNVLRRLQALDLTRQELSNRSGVSISFLSELTAARANPSLRVLEALAAALETSLPSLLVEPDQVPTGYRLVSAVLPERRAVTVERWAREAAQQRRKLSS